MIRVRVTTSGYAEIEHRLHQTEELVSPLGVQAFIEHRGLPLMKAQIGQTFATETSPSGAAWAALTPATQHFRRSSGYPAAHPINVRSGAMKRFLLTSHRVEGVVGGVEASIPGVEPTGLLGKKLMTAQVGSKGGKKGGGRTTPARPVLGWSPVLADQVVTSLSRHVEQVIND